MPPSKRTDEPLYDDRMLRVLHALDEGRQLDIRELLVVRESTKAAHVKILGREIVIEDALITGEASSRKNSSRSKPAAISQMKMGTPLPRPRSFRGVPEAVR